MITKNNIIIYILIIIELIILFNSSIVTNSIKTSIKVFINNIIPSLLPTMIIGNILINYNIEDIIPKFILKLFNKIFNFDNINTSIFLLSILLGSPINSILINNYIEDNKEKISMVKCTLYVNPLFTIFACKMLFNSIKIAIIFITIFIIKNMLFAFLLKENFNNKKNNYIYKKLHIKDILISCSKALFIIFNIITFTNIIINLINNYIYLGPLLKTILLSLLEVSSSIINLTKMPMIYRYIFGFLSLLFTGLSIILQSFSLINKKN